MPEIPESDEALLAECDIEVMRGSGPGGQARNKTENAVRLTHRATGIVVQAGERRSRTQNFGVAVDRLRAALRVRFAPPPPPRRPTRPTRGSQERRHAAKARRGGVKVLRGKVNGES